MIELKNISKTYIQNNKSLKALDNINLSVKAGEIFGVVGESGAGKSTLIRCVNLLERPDEGAIVEVSGCNLMNLAEKELLLKRHKIGMIFQHFNLLANRTVKENVALPLEFYKTEKNKIKNRVLELLELTGLLDKKDFYPAELSGGQKQRVAIARALASQPELLLSDEATSALDPKTTMQILELLKKINQELNLTILLITHEMEVVKNICNSVALLEKGRLVEKNTVKDFFTNPQSELGKKFIAQIQNLKLPEKIKFSSEGKYPIVKIYFNSEVVDEPILSLLIKKFGVDINIIQAQTEYIGNMPTGQIIIELFSEEEKITQALNYLQSLELKSEVLGYVSGNH